TAERRGTQSFIALPTFFIVSVYFSVKPCAPLWLVLFLRWRCVSRCSASCFRARRIQLVPRWAFAFEPQRSAMLATFCRRSRINTLSQIQVLGVFLCTQRREHALRRKRRLVQSNSH